MAEYSIYNSQWTAQQIEASIGKNPRIGDGGTWEVWDMATMQWVDTGIAPSGGVPIPVTYNLLKGDGNGGVVAGAAETDLQSKITASGILKGNGAGGVSAAVAGTDFAPAGFGLGAVLYNAIADCNDTTLGNGFYTLSAATLNYPSLIPNAQYGILLVQIRGTSIYQSFSYGEYFAKRRYTGTAWTEWEYVNPPMLVGVEYRTTERYMGKPVYVKTINFGALPNSTDKSVSTGYVNGEMMPLSVTGHFYTGVDRHTIPYDYSSSQYVHFTNFNSTTVVIKTGWNASAFTAYLTIKFTKDAD